MLRPCSCNKSNETRCCWPEKSRKMSIFREKDESERDWWGGPSKNSSHGSLFYYLERERERDDIPKFVGSRPLLIIRLTVSCLTSKTRTREIKI